MFHIAPFSSNQLLNLFGGLDSFGIEPSYRTGIEESEDDISIAIEMPGFEKGRISILREDNILSVTADRQTTSKGCQGSRSFSRKFALPRHVDLEQIDAEYKDGILAITAKKHETAKPKKIEIK